MVTHVYSNIIKPYREEGDRYTDRQTDRWADDYLLSVPHMSS